jgi:hypothetical protein
MTGEYGMSAPWPAGHGPMVRRLAAIAERAVATQPEADAAIRACGIVGVVSSDVAIRLGEMLRGYSRLYYEADALEATAYPGLAEVRRNLIELLSYHLHMLRDAGDLVFSGRDVAHNERFRLELAEGLGSRAEDLTRLRERLIWDECV